jgi:hypothetical protein
MLVRLLVASLLFAHAMVHVAFVTPTPPMTAGGPTWPFTTSRSWLATRFSVSPDLLRGLAMALVAATLSGFGLAALAAIGLVPATVWTPAIVTGSAASLGLLIAFFNPWLLIGVAIDVGLLWASLMTSWNPIAADQAL